MANERENVFSRVSDWWGERKERAKNRWSEKPEILQDAERYLRKNVYDPGWIGTQYPGNKTWMETVPSEMMQSYRESESPYRHGITDAFVKAPINAAWNLAQFFGNVGWEGGHALDRMMPTWLGGQDAPIFSDETKYGWDAQLSDKFGWDTYYEDNPFQNAVFNEQGQITDYDNKYWKKIKETAGKESDDYWFDILKQNDENKDKLHDDIADYTYEQMPEYSDWAWNNPDAKVEDYNKLGEDIYNKRIEELYGDKINTVFDNSMDSQMFSEYGFGEKDKSAFADFDLWDYSRALDYSTPEAEEFYKVAELAPELLFPLGGLSKLKHLKSLRGAPKKEGIMGAKRLEGPTDYDWAEEWLRNRR